MIDLAETDWWTRHCQWLETVGFVRRGKRMLYRFADGHEMWFAYAGSADYLEFHVCHTPACGRPPFAACRYLAALETLSARIEAAGREGRS